MVHYNRNSLEAILAEGQRKGLTPIQSWKVENFWADAYVRYQDNNPRIIEKEPMTGYVKRTKESAGKETREYLNTLVNKEE